MMLPTWKEVKSAEDCGRKAKLEKRNVRDQFRSQCCNVVQRGRCREGRWSKRGTKSQVGQEACRTLVTLPKLRYCAKEKGWRRREEKPAKFYNTNSRTLVPAQKRICNGNWKRQRRAKASGHLFCSQRLRCCWDGKRLAEDRG
jgi:hypothetical protein